jgi:hypothetical protein
MIRNSFGTGSVLVWVFVVLLGSCAPDARASIVLTPSTNGDVVKNLFVYDLGDSGLTAGYDYGGNGYTSVILFQLPAKTAGQVVTSASFQLYADGYTAPAGATSTFNADLSALVARTTSKINLNDYYSGAYGGEPREIGIQDNFMTPGLVAGEVTTSSSGNVALAAYMNAQYASAGAGAYVVLRINPDFTTPPSMGIYYNTEGAYSVIEPGGSLFQQSPAHNPMLTLDFTPTPEPTLAVVGLALPLFVRRRSRAARR